MVIEGTLEGEMDDHLGYAKHDPAGRDGAQPVRYAQLG
jgi:putative transposase